MEEKYISEEIVFPVEFYDVDTMRVVWHGNYVKYMEKARCALLDKIGFGYLEMEKAKVAFPVVDMRLKYIRSVRFGEKVKAVATLVEWENRIKIKYEMYNAQTGELVNKAESTQMAVDMEKNESLFECPKIFLVKVQEMLKNEQA